MGFNYWGNNSVPSVLFVNTNQVDISEMNFLMANQTVYANNGGPVNNVAQVATFALTPPTQLVENWINYSSLDVIFLSLADVENLAAARPKVWQAVRAGRSRAATCA